MKNYKKQKSNYEFYVEVSDPKELLEHKDLMFQFGPFMSKKKLINL